MLPYRPIPVINNGRRLGVEAVPVPSAPYISVERKALAMPAPNAYKEGDRVQIVAWPRHDPYHKNATVEVVHQGPTYGVSIDGMEDMGIHKWYVGQELRPGPKFREIGPVVLVPDVIMAGIGAVGIGASLLMKNPTASMVTLMVSSMALAVGIHGTLMRLTQGAVSAAVKA
jgi:hypothetical protein